LKDAKAELGVEASSRWKATSAENLDFSKLKILLVEDSPDNQNLVQRILSRRSAQVAIVNNGVEAIETAMKEEPDVILMDVQMPVMDGYTATQRLRELGFAKPIIALTAHAMNQVHQRCLEVGCTDYLPKPINASELVRKIAQHTAH